MTSANRFLTTSEKIDALAKEKTLQDIDTFIKSGELIVNVDGGITIDDVKITDYDFSANPGGVQTSNVSINIAQVSGTAVSFGAGDVDNGCQRVVLPQNEQVPVRTLGNILNVSDSNFVSDSTTIDNFTLGPACFGNKNGTGAVIQINDDSGGLDVTNTDFVNNGATVNASSFGSLLYGSDNGNAIVIGASEIGGSGIGTLLVDITGNSLGNLDTNWNQTANEGIVIGNGVASPVGGSVPRFCIANDNDPIEVKTNGTPLDVNLADATIPGPLPVSDSTDYILGISPYTENVSAGGLVAGVRNDILNALVGDDQDIAPLQVNDVGSMQTALNDINRYGRPQTDPLEVEASRWELITSSFWSPFTERFVAFNNDTAFENDNTYFWTTAAGGALGSARSAIKYKLKPNSVIEVTFSCELRLDLNTTNPLDRQIIGLYSTDPAGPGLFPKVMWAITTNAGDAQPDKWKGIVYYNNGVGISTTNDFLTVPSDLTDQVFRIRIENYILPKTTFLQYDQTSQQWITIETLQSNIQQFDTYFYFGNIAENSGAGSATQSSLFDYEIKESVPSIAIYRNAEIPIYNSYAYTTEVDVDQGNDFAVAGIRLNQNNIEQLPVWIDSIIFNIDTGGEEFIFSVYKNPTLSAAHTFNINYGRVQLSQLEDTITITSGTPFYTEFANSSNGSSRYGVIKLPPQTLGLYDTNDEIYIVARSLNNNNEPVYFGFNYYY